MQKKIQIFIRQYHMIEENDHVAVGVSGGADSVCLLLLLCELRKSMHFRLTAVHVEHGIRGAESLADAAFVKQLCADWNVPLRTFSVDALHQAKTQHQSLEEAARELRYRCFYEACRNCQANRLAVAHHGDDCAETVLFHPEPRNGAQRPVRHCSCAGTAGAEADADPSAALRDKGRD